ncbi:MAG: cupin domain-containing protein [Kiloniellales bacterium]
MTLKAPALDPMTLPPRKGSSYPRPFAEAAKDREKRALGDPLGLTRFGVNLVKLPPGCFSSQRHWHTHEDEFVFVLSGELTLVTDAGEQRLTAGTAAGFPAGRPDGHRLINSGAEPAFYLEVGNRIEADACHYPDIDLYLEPGPNSRFVRKNGEPY